jgi:hypothetical protein
MKLSFSAYCGMTYDIDSTDDARKSAAKFIRARRKNGQPVVKLRHNVWECQEPENCSMIPDTAGILALDDEDDEDEDNWEDLDEDWEDEDDYEEDEYWQNENEDQRDDF